MTESEFLALTESIGLEWTTPLGELKARHGVRRWFDFADVVDVPLQPLTPSIAGAYYVRYRPQDEPWPPDTYVWESIAKRDVMAEQAALTEELVRVLGPGENHRAINVVGRTWTMGLFRVEITTFTRHDKEIDNPLYQRHPELWNCTKVTLQTRHFAFAPDETLARFGALPDLLTVVPRFAGPWHWFAPLIKRTPNALTAHLPRRNVAVRFDDGAGTIAILGRDLSLVLVRAYCVRLRLFRAERGRGPGYATIEADYRHALAHGVARTITLFHGSGTKSLDELAPRLAHALKLRLSTVEGCDD